MALTIGIVGLPNVGKSTLFNAITNAQNAEAANFPFCTIEPNVGIVSIPDDRLQQLAGISGSTKILPATIEFNDIAGLVKGASKGEGLGNKFLTHIRETSAIAHVVRCFEDENIIHVEGRINPIEDIEIINTELVLADLEMAEKMLNNQRKRAKSQSPDEKALLAILEKLVPHLGEGNPIRQMDLNEDEQQTLKGVHFLTSKKSIYVCNVAEDEAAEGNTHTKTVQDYAAQFGDECIIVSAKIEEELSGLTEEESAEFLEELGLKESGLGRLAKSCFKLLALHTYLTTGPKETRAWTIPEGAKAPQAAGVIHTDFEAGFIRANIVKFTDFITCKGLLGAKEKGLLNQEGKDYVMQDGDVVEFLFNN
ncbi:redox-regulated ATPase YchF [bacterium]|jgi:ribosome-binding ATPase|nr:redox-regulated ATPase YchF [bacterium]